MEKLEIEIAEIITEYRDRTGKQLTIGTTESATGGGIADRLTNTPGSSNYFKGSVVAYSDKVKIDILGVREETIENHGVVSSQTAIEMAQGGKRLLGVDVCVSDTGIAGPSGGSSEKPVGLFYIGLAARDDKFSRSYVFQGNREENKRRAAEEALNILKQYLIQYLNKWERDQL